MMRTIPAAYQENPRGSCWTCIRRDLICDGGLPRCGTCTRDKRRCSGFGVHIRWPDELIPKSKSRQAKKRRGKSASPLNSDLPTQNKRVPSISASMPQPGLTQQESFFMQHFLQNISKIALAIDYDGNGYRQLLPLAMEEPALMNGMLAVASSHHSRWQGVEDKDSKAYLRASTMALSKRFQQPQLVDTPTTLACMLILSTFEVFSGSNRWRSHYDAIRGWITSRRHQCELSDFFKAWICLLDTQCSLNLGQSGIPKLRDWLDVPSGLKHADNTVDVLFGCSIKMPRLMRSASELNVMRSARKLSPREIEERASTLQDEIKLTQIREDSEISLGVACQKSQPQYTAILFMDEAELRQRMVATAEIFRHCLHLYVFRIAYGPGIILSEDMQCSLRTALNLLTLVPDVLGPGANLGWCLVVIGAELDMPEERNYIRSRIEGLELLGINNCCSGKRVLEEVWNQRDQSHVTTKESQRWQDIMKERGDAQILI